jgi:formylglycine-generating enzyme required for sulfatase activity
MHRDTSSDAVLREQFRLVARAASELGVDTDRALDAVAAGYPNEALVRFATGLETLMKAVWRALGKGDPPKELGTLIARCKDTLAKGPHPAYDARIFNYAQMIQLTRNQSFHDQDDARPDTDLADATSNALDVARRFAVMLDWYQQNFMSSAPPLEPVGDAAVPDALRVLAGELIERRRVGGAMTVFLGRGCFFDSGTDASRRTLEALGGGDYEQMAARLNSAPSAAGNAQLDALDGSLPTGYVALGHLLAEGWFDVVATTGVDHFLERGLVAAGIRESLIERLVFDGTNGLDLLAALARPRSRLRVVKVCGDLAEGHWRWCAAGSPAPAAAAAVLVTVLRRSSLLVGLRSGDLDVASALDVRGDRVCLAARSSAEQRVEVQAPSIDSVFTTLRGALARTSVWPARRPEAGGRGEAGRTRRPFDDEERVHRLAELQNDVARLRQELAQSPRSRDPEAAERERAALSALVTEIDALSQAGEGTVLGNYRVAELLGRGTVAGVYRATNIYTDNPAAIKIIARDQALDHTSRTRFFHSADAMRTINHPNVVDVRDEGEEGPWCYYVMELVEGPALERALTADSLSPEQRWLVAEKTVAAVAAAHQAGVVHGGLKASDVLLRADADVRVSDFGMGPRPDAWDPAIDAVPSEAMSFHAAPEVRRGSALAALRDPRVDVFSLGRILLRLLTGIPPVERDALQYATDAGGVRMLLAMRGVPGPAVTSFGHVLSRAMEFDPARRFASAVEMLDALHVARRRAESFSSGQSLIDFPLHDVPRGRFLMGSPPGEVGRGPEEVMHPVELTQWLHVAETPVTRRMWATVWGEEPPPLDQQRLPVERVSWWDAVAFCNAMSLSAGLTPCYSFEHGAFRWDRTADGFRLPTEAEWEYAARAGSTTAYCTGDAVEDLHGVAWYGANSGEQLREVGLRDPNAWGIRDMHGNVWEWCWDWFGPYDPADAVDPSGPADGTERVLRGGSCRRPAAHCRSAHRYFSFPSNHGRSLGFRVVRSRSLVEGG